MTIVGRFVFAECVSLTKVTIPNGVTAIGDNSFFRCTSLTDVVIPESVTSIGGFFGCTSLTAINVDPRNPAYASEDGVLFDKAKSQLLAYPGGKAGAYVIPSSVTAIWDPVFKGCIGLTRLTIPATVADIWTYGVFGGNTNLKGIDVDALNPNYSSLDGVLFDKPQSKLIAYPGGKAETYTIPDAAIGIGYNAFSDCSRLTNVIIGSSIERIYEGAFSGCTGLTSVSIPNSVTAIGDHAFTRCTSLKSVTIPSSVILIGNAAFSECTNLTRAYFEGARPYSGGIVRAFDPYAEEFSGSPFVTSFYRAGTIGWGPTYGGRPTAVWEPLAPYADWAKSAGLTAQLPVASAETDDPDGDGLTNRAEWLAGTDPTQPASRLELESVPRPADLAEFDRTPVPAGKHVVYFRSVPGRYYGVQRASSLHERLGVARHARRQRHANAVCVG